MIRLSFRKLFVYSSGLGLALSCSWAVVAAPATSGDFNGDGFTDLAVGVPKETVGTIIGAGSVNVIYGSAGGLHRSAAVANQVWHQNSNGIEETCETSDNFGAALASGDFNGDGFSDLAIGVPGEDIAAGAVNVIYGSAAGLTADGDQVWTQNSPGILGSNQSVQRFGAALSVGDFNNDGFDDLAIGVPTESEAGELFAGAVNVIYGSAAGLFSAGNQFWDQTATGTNASELQDAFGSALASGDFNGDGYADLAVGSPGESIGTKTKCGAISIIFGSAAGLNDADSQFWHQNRSGIVDKCETDDAYGSSLAAGDFNNDGFADLAIGVPGEDVGTFVDAGAVAVMYGSANGLTASGDQIWHQNSSGILDAAEAQQKEGFGTSLAAGYFNNDAFCDLAIGVPYEDIVSVLEGGIVHVLYGRSDKLRAKKNQIWSQDSSGVSDAAEDGDRWGFALGAGDFNGDGKHDLVVGIPGESIGFSNKAGAVHVFYGGGTVLSSTGSYQWHQNRPGIADKCETEDGFGSAAAP